MKIFVKFSERHPEPEVAHMDSRKIVLFGLGLWCAVLLVLIAFYSSLADAGLLWWIGTAVVGILLGFLALYIVRKR